MIIVVFAVPGADAPSMKVGLSEADIARLEKIEFSSPVRPTFDELECVNLSFGLADR